MREAHESKRDSIAGFDIMDRYTMCGKASVVPEKLLNSDTMQDEVDKAWNDGDADGGLRSDGDEGGSDGVNNDGSESESSENGGWGGDCDACFREDDHDEGVVPVPVARPVARPGAGQEKEASQARPLTSADILRGANNSDPSLRVPHPQRVQSGAGAGGGGEGARGGVGGAGVESSCSP